MERSIQADLYLRCVGIIGAAATIGRDMLLGGVDEATAKFMIDSGSGLVAGNPDQALADAQRWADAGYIPPGLEDARRRRRENTSGR